MKKMPAFTVSQHSDRDVLVAQRMMGLDTGYTEADLRKAYKKGCKKLAPDKGGCASDFVKLQKAHALLIPFARRSEVHVTLETAQLTRDGAAGEESVSRGGEAHQGASANQGNKKYKSVNEAYAAIHGNVEGRLRGHGDWLKRDVREDLRPPEKVPEARLHETFEKLSASRGTGPWTVSTHVVKPLDADTSVGYPIHDDAEDYSDGRWLADLQAAYGPV